MSVGHIARSKALPSYFIALVALGLFLATCFLFLPAFAEQAPAKSIPVMHTRAIVESVHVVSAMGNAPSAPAVHVRAISDSLSVSTAFPQQTGQNTIYRSHTTSTGLQRMEERHPLQTTPHRTGQYADTRAVENMSATPIIIVQPDTWPPDGGGEDPPDDSDLQYLLLSDKSIDAASSYSATAYSAMGIAVIALYARNSGSLGLVSTRAGVLARTGSYVFARYAALGRGAKAVVLAGLATAAIASVSNSDVLSAFADSPAGMAYRIGTSGGLGYREWDPQTASWSSEVSLTSAGSQIEVVKFLYSPTAGSELRIIGVRETSGEIDIYYCTANCTSAGNWNGPNLVADMGSPSGGRKYFDMAFESSSGDVLIVYDKTTTTDTSDFFYQVFDADTLTLSGESGFDYISDTTADNDIRFFKMASKPGSDEIAVALLDATNSDVVALIWNGSSFGNTLTVTDTVLSASLAGESFDIVYESASGAALVVAPGLASSATRYARYTGSWSAVSTLSGGINPDITTDDQLWMTLKADPNPNSNKVMACATDDASDFSCVQFDAGSPGTATRHEAATGGSSRRGDFAWVGWDSTGLALWYDSGAAEYQYRTWTSSSSTWGTENAAAASQTILWVTAASDNDSTASGVDSLWAFYSQASPDSVGDGEYDATTFTLNGLGTISTSAGTANTDDVVSLDSRKLKSSSRSPSDSVTINDEISINVFSPGHPQLFETVSIADSIRIAIPRSLSETLDIDDDIPFDENSAGIAYRSSTGNGENFPKYREWRPQLSAWSSEVELPTAGSPVRYAWIEFSPVSAKRVIVTLSDDGFLDSYACDYSCMSASSWTVQNNIVNLWTTAPSGVQRPFDIEYEQTSGDLILVYDRVSTDGTQDLFYRIMPAGSHTFGSEGTINDTTATATDTAYSFIRMDSRRTSGSDAIGMIALDETNSDAVAWVWNGSSWGSEHELTATASTGTTEVVGIAYETNSGNLVAVAGEGTGVRYNRFTTSWQTSSTSTGTWDVGTISWIKMTQHPSSTSNEILLGVVGSLSDLDSSYWDGSTWTDHAEHDAGLGSIAGPSFDFVWESDGSGLLIWGTTSGQLDFKRFAAPNTFSSQSSFSESGTHNWVQIFRNPTAADDVAALGVTIDNSNDIGGIRWDGGTSDPVSTGDNAITIVGLDTYESLRIDFQKSSIIQRTVSDSVGVADSVARAYTASRSPSDTLSLADNILPHVTRVVEDSVSLTDTARFSVSRSVADSVSFADSISINVFSPTNPRLFETVSVTDQLEAISSRGISDSLGVSDSTSKTVTKSLFDSVTITDTAAIMIVRPMSETIGISDSLARSLAAQRSASDSLSIADSIPSDDNVAGIAYRSSTGSGDSFPKYRQWNPLTFAWSQEVELPDAGSTVRFTWIEFSPVSSKRVVVTLSDDGYLDSFVCDDSCTSASSWDVQNDVAQVRTTLTGIERPFDIEYEQTSGDLLLVYDKVSTDGAQDLFYRVMPDASTTFGSEFSIDDSTASAADTAYSFIRMDSRRTSGSDAIGMIALDRTNSDAIAFVWNGSAWGNEHELTATASDASTESIDVAYESSSGALVMAAGEGTAIRYNRFTTSWQTSSTSSGTWDVGTVNWVRLVPNPQSSSNGIFLAATGSASDFDSAYWDGSSWTDHAEHDNAVGGVAGRGFDFAWAGDSSDGVMIWKTTSGVLDFKTFTAPDTFSAQGNFVESTSHNWIQLVTNPETGDFVSALGATIDTGNDIGGIRWNGAGFVPESTGDNAITIVGLDTYESVQVDFQKATRVSKSASETLAVSDSLVPLQTLGRSISDSLGIADDPRAHIPTPLAESVSIGDSISKSVSKSVSDSLAVEESLTVQGGGQNSISVSDSVSVSASVSRTYVAPRSLTETVTITDSITPNVIRLLADSLAASDSVEVASAASSSRAGAAYRSDTGTSGLQSPKYREWDPSSQTWSSEVELPSTGSDVRDAKVLFSPSSSLHVIVSLSADGSLNLFKCDASCTSASSWTHVGGASFANVGSLAAGTPYRPFDIAFEQDSGTLLIVYDKGLTETADFYYRTFAGSTLSSEGSFDYIGSSADAEEILYFKMASKAGSDEITMVLLDATNTDSYAFVWNGSSFGNQLTLSSSLTNQNLTGESVGVAYETASGASVVFSGNGDDSASYARWSGSSWSSVQTTDPNTSTSQSRVAFARLSSDPAAGSNKIMMCEADQHSDLLCAEIDSGVLGSWVVHDIGITTIATRPFDFAWNPSGSKGVLVWGTAASSKSYKVYDGSWGAEQTISSAGTNRWIVGAPSPSGADVANSLFLTLNSVLDIGTSKFKFGTLASLGDSTHTADTAANTYEGMSIDFQKSSNINLFISDELQMNDIVSKSVARVIDDSVGVSDTITAKITALAISDSLAVTDTVVAKITAVLVSDSLEVTDSVTAKVTARAISDSLAVTDSVAARISGISVADSVGVSDAVAAKVTSRAIADTLAVSDSVTARVTARAIADDLSVTDSISARITALAISDSLAVTDTIVAKITARGINDDLAVTDSVTAKVTAAAIIDSLGVSDAIDARITGVAAADTLSVTDDVDATVTKEIPDALDIDDGIAMRVSRSITESLGVADALRGQPAVLNVADQISLTDDIEVAASKGASDSVSVSDDVAIRLMRAVSDSLSLNDTATASLLRPVSDSLAVSDTLSSSITRSLSDSVAVADSTSRSADMSRQVSDELAIGDTAGLAFTRSISDSLLASDSASALKVFGRVIGDSLDLSDNIDRSIISSIDVSEDVSVSDNLGRAFVGSRSSADNLSIADSVEATKTYNRQAAESLAVTDSFSRSLVSSREIAEPIAVSDALTTGLVASRQVSDGLAVGDAVVAGKSISVGISDALGIADTAMAMTGFARSIDDALVISEEIARPPIFDERVTITDNISLSHARSLSDSVQASDGIRASRFISISDSLGVTSSMLVVWSGTLQFNESFALGDGLCLPSSCIHNLALGESLGMQDAWIGPPELEDTIAIADSVDIDVTRAGPTPVDSLSVTDSAATTLELAPPAVPAGWGLTEMPRAMAVTDPDAVEPPEAPKLPGTYDISAGIESLLEQTDMPVYSMSQMLSATDMAGKTLVFPAFQVSTTPTSDLPGHNVIMTPIMDVLPADTAVSFPVDISATLSEESTEQAVSWMKIDYTPRESATNFALALSMLDSKPESAQDVQAEVSAFFIDVDWAGTFAGSADPSDPDFYTESPSLTFAITDEWASEQGLERDDNGVPVMEMFLLNDDTGEWEEVLDIDSPAAAEDGLYTYVAHLEHFSTYVVTSELAQFGGSGVSFHVPVSFTALISDTIAVTDAQRVGAFEVIEEFTGGKSVSVGILDALRVGVKPVAFSETLQLGRGVTVAIALDDVYTARILPPEVRALLILEVANSSDSPEEFEIELRYFDQSGRMAYESVETIRADANKVMQRAIEVPFNSAGDFVVNLDARAIDDNRLLGTAQIEVTVPWLAANMHVIIVAAAATLAGAGATMAYIMRRQKTGGDAQVL